MKSEVVFFIGIKRVFDIELIAIAILGYLVEFIPLSIRKFLLHLYIMIVLHCEDKIRSACLSISEVICCECPSM